MLFTELLSQQRQASQEADMGEALISALIVMLGFAVTAAGIFVAFYG